MANVPYIAMQKRTNQPLGVQTSSTTLAQAPSTVTHERAMHFTMEPPKLDEEVGFSCVFNQFFL